MANIISENISVFPAVRRNTEDSRRFSEKNLTQYILKSVADKESYVISETYNTDENLEFIIYGYYFNVKAAKITEVAGDDLYAHIYIDTNANPELIGIDSDGIFTGLDITDSEDPNYPSGYTDETATHKYLHILTKPDDFSSYIIPDNSKPTIRIVDDVPTAGAIIL